MISITSATASAAAAKSAAVGTTVTTPTTTTSDITPPSPSLSSTSFISSVSWTQKSPNELIPMLKNAYSTLKDKERDLRLAAEIGKSLLENNMALKSNYEDLLNTPFPTPTNSSSLIKKTPIKEQEEYEKNLKYVPPHSTREALVEILEKENADLSLQLETVLLNQEKLDRTNTKKSRKLETEVKFLQTSLDHATIKIQEMEENRKKKTLTKDGCTKLTFNTDGSTTIMNNHDETVQQIWIDENDRCVESLTAQLEQLKLENDHVNQSKVDVEKKVCTSLQDLRLLKQQFEQFQFTTEDHDRLKQAFEAQHLHIQELKDSLEEHRTILQKLKDRGIYIPSSLDTSSVSASSVTSDEMYKRKLREDNLKRDNLLTELENAWFKHQTSPPRTRQSTATNNTTSIIFHPFQAIYNQLPNVDSALESILLKASVVEKDALDDALSLIGRLEDEYDHEKFLQEKRHIYYKDDYDNLDKVDGHEEEEEEEYYHYHGRDDDYVYYLQQQQQEEEYYDDLPSEAVPSGLFGYAKHAVKSMIYMTWRWFRFTLIMIIAVFISLKEGPDGL